MPIRVLLGALLLALTPLAGPADSARAEPESEPALRVLLVGDSVTQGTAGDWTWRYRLWQHLVGAGVAVDLVGPHDGLYDPRTGGYDSQAYLDADFDRDHAARWGNQLAHPRRGLRGLVATYRPDLVVVALGVNDLLLGRATNAELAADALGLGRAARTADPDVGLVYAHVAQRWAPGARDLNARLDSLPEALGGAVAIARTEVGFRRLRDTYDGRHPSSRGELRIAAAVADALAGLGVGTPYPRPLARLPLGPRQAPRLRAEVGGGLVLLRWRDPPGVDREYLWQRDLTAGTGWRRRLGPIRAGVILLGGFRPGHRYALRLQPARGFHRAARDVRSDRVVVRPR